MFLFLPPPSCAHGTNALGLAGAKQIPWGSPRHSTLWPLLCSVPDSLSVLPLLKKRLPAVTQKTQGEESSTPM